MTDDWLNMKGKVVIVTGGSSGIGAEIVQSLSKNGAQVIIADISGSAYENVDFIQCDITNQLQVEEMMDKVVAKYTRIDGLINNAGVNRPKLLVDYYRGDKAHEFDEADFDFLFNVNVKGAFFCAQAAARVMIRQQCGVVVNISSEAGMEGSVGQSIYSATKGALNSFTLSWAKELGRFNIRVIGVAPGINEPTPMGNPEHVKALAYTRGIESGDVSVDYMKMIPLGRQGKLEEIADLVTYLLSDRSSYISGTILNITGGKSRG
ncbi:SDR family oxidoreductase [Paenibacillus fonticola]|uniref:SDR family oxidoreductase n=1 Tax=Paenibacillus fonticola TaxID=379896 RepID=UPI00036F10E7|nr:SDR family oxidoreductase [Paenibacillus fonticola]